MPGAKGADVATDAQGSVLLDSEGDEHARIQRRDLLTGSLISQTAAILSVTKPVIGGILCGSAWLSNSGGMAGTFFRLNAKTLRSPPAIRWTAAKLTAPPQPLAPLASPCGWRSSDCARWAVDHPG